MAFDNIIGGADEKKAIFAFGFVNIKQTMNRLKNTDTKICYLM